MKNMFSRLYAFLAAFCLMACQAAVASVGWRLTLTDWFLKAGS